MGKLLTDLGPLSRYEIFERFVTAILSSQIEWDPAQAAEFAGQRALAMLKWIDEHEDEVLGNS